MPELSAQQADTDCTRYLRALVENGHSTCVAIEQRWDLYGYPPSIVTNVLRRVAAGEDRDAAEDAALGGNYEG